MTEEINIYIDPNTNRKKKSQNIEKSKKKYE